MPDPATQFPQAGLQGGQYWPVEYHPGNMQTLQPVTYGAITDALKTGLDEIKNSPLNPVVAEARRAQMAQLKTAQAEAGLNQTVLADIQAHPENYAGLLGYKVGQGAEILPTGSLANNWAAQNAGGGYGYKAPPPPAKKEGDGGGGGGGQQKTAEQTQTQGGDATELAAAQAWYKKYFPNLDSTKVTRDANGNYVLGDQVIDAGTVRTFQNSGNAQVTGNSGNQQSNGNQPSKIAAGSGTTQMPTAANPAKTTQQQTWQGRYAKQDVLNMYNTSAQPNARATDVRQEGGNNVFLDANGNPINSEQIYFHAGGLVSSPFRPMAMAAPPPAPMFMQAGGPVPGGQGQVPGAMPPGGAPQAPIGAVPPEQMQQWQNATQGNTASAKAALEWAQNNMDTAIKRAVLMRGGGPGGQDAYAFFGPKGGSNIVPVMQMMVHGFAPEIISQNTTSHLSAAPQPATPPPAAPQGPIRMQEGGVVPQGNAQTNAQANANPSASPYGPTNPGGFSVQGPVTGDQLAQLMNQPGAVTEQSTNITNPDVRKFQFEANRKKDPGDSLGGAPYHNNPDEVNITGKDGFIGAGGGEVNSPLMAKMLHTLITSGAINDLPKADNGDPIIKTLRNGTVIRADMSHNNGAGQPSGAPYISYSQDPYHDVRLYAGMDHTVLHQNTDQELAQNVAAITHFPADVIAGMSREAKLDLLYSKYRQENLPNLPADIEKNFNDFHSILQYGARSENVLNNMSPGEYDIASTRWNQLKNVAGNPVMQAWDAVTHPFGLFRPGQGQDTVTIDKNWSKLQQNDQAMRAYISGKADLDGTDKKFLLDSLGDPAFTNADYPGRLHQFMKDQLTNYQIAVRKAEAQGYYVPQIFKDDMVHIGHTGQVLDPNWTPVTPTKAAASSTQHAGGGPQDVSGNKFPEVNWSKTPPQGVGQDRDHGWNLDNMSEAQRRYTVNNAAKGTFVTMGGKTIQLQ